MPSLFNFIHLQDTPIVQTPTNKQFGVESVDTFQITTEFTLTTEVSAYAMLGGRVLLQPQGALDSGKVNLILKPEERRDLKLPVKYIIYRGLKTSSFLNQEDIQGATVLPSNHSPISELLTQMWQIQTQRTTETIPLEALFGYQIDFTNTEADAVLLDQFFYKKTNLSSQLFPITAGIELGTFAVGEVGIDMIVENPEYEPNVSMARQSSYHIEVSGITNPAEKKWHKDQIRHFVDPVAFYGLHHDIKGGIGYKDNGGAKVANSIDDIYDIILKQFAFTGTNQVYLDIRNENGYSYNYYGNYKGNTGMNDDDNKELRIAEGTEALVLEEYYTQGWPIHIMEVMNPDVNEYENQIRLSLRINDNERPLIAGWNAKIVEADKIYPLAEPLPPPLVGTHIINSVYFVNDFTLLFKDLFNPPPPHPKGFTHEITIKIPNKPATASIIVGQQIPTIVRLDYIKQLQLNETAQNDAFPQQNPTDYLFGPITAKIPWDSDNNVQWMNTNHYKYYDGLTQGVITFIIRTTLKNVQTVQSNTKITVAGSLEENVFLPLVGIKSTQNVAQNILSTSYNANDNTTDIVIEGGNGGRDFDPPLVTKNTQGQIVKNVDLPISFELHFMARVDYVNNRFIIENEDLSQFNNVDIKYAVKEYFPSNSYSSLYNDLYQNVNISYTGTHSYIEPEAGTFISKKGIRAILYTGIVSETDKSTSPGTDNDNVILYALPKFYNESFGAIVETNKHLEGGTSRLESFFESIHRIDRFFRIYRTSFEQPEGSFKSLLVSIPTYKIKPEIWALALKKAEWNILKDQTQSSVDGRNFSNYHLKTFKLILQEGLSRSVDYKTYYHYKLVIAGLDTEGKFLQTKAADGIDIYSEDGLLFSSDAYAQTLQKQGSQAKVEFRRYGKNLPTKYGFDWMRDNYVKYSNLSISADTNLMSDAEAQEFLKQEYTPFIFEEQKKKETIYHDYYTPWLAIYHQDAQGTEREADGWTIKNNTVPEHLQAEKIVRLKLTAKKINKEQVLQFKIPEGIAIRLENEKGERISPNNEARFKDIDHIAIKCTEKSPLDRKLYVYDKGSNELVGVLNIFKNHNTYKIPVRFVLVNIRGTLNGKSYPMVTKNTNFKQTDSTSFKKWDEHIKEHYVYSKKVAFQALLDYDPYLLKPVSFNKDKLTSDIDYHTIDIDFGGNYDINPNYTASSIFNGLEIIKQGLKGLHQGNNLIIDKTTFAQGLDTIYKNTDETVTIFLPPVKLFGNPPVKGNNATTTAYGILLNDYKDAKNNTIIHEIAHVLGLDHPFVEPGKSVGKHAFKQYETENIMDYIKTGVGKPAKLSFWKWQWEKMHQNDKLILDS